MSSSWQDDLHLVPTRNRDLLGALLGTTLARLVHHVDDPDELLASPSYEGVGRTKLFAFGYGPVVLESSQGTHLTIYSSEELASVTVDTDEESGLLEDWPFAIDAADPRYSEPRFAEMIGRRIVGVRVLQLDLDEDRLRFGERFFFPKVLSRPREAALIFDLEGTGGLLFSASLLRSPDHFGVFTADDLKDSQLPVVEVLRLQAR